MDNILVSRDPDYPLLFSQIVEGLLNQGWVVIPDFFSPELMLALYQELLDHEAHRELLPAKVGKGEQEVLRKDIRGDGILWLDGSSEDQKLFMLTMEMLQNHLNQQLFLGLDELEAHFALYPAGTGYQRHLDSFQQDNLRKVTVVTYLNPEWDSTMGGELRLFNGEEVIAKVLPTMGTLVCFISDEIPHEVVVTHAKRASIAGWFRRREII